MELNALVQHYLHTKDEHSFIELEEIFSPLIQSYTRKLYYLERDDCTQEFHLALFEALLSIKDTENSGKCFSYIQTVIYHRFCKLYSESKARKTELDNKIDVENLEAYSHHSNDFDDCLFFLELNQNLKKVDAKKKLILVLLYMGWSDEEIAKLQNCSKQYINRIKKNILFKNKR